MPTIVYITSDGTRHEVEVENGYSVMEGAINNNIPGIVAECGRSEEHTSELQSQR